MGFSGVPEVVATNSPSYLPWLSAMLSPGRAVVSASPQFPAVRDLGRGGRAGDPLAVRSRAQPACRARGPGRPRAGRAGWQHCRCSCPPIRLLPSEEVVRVSAPVDGSCPRAASDARPATRMARSIPVAPPVRRRGDVTDPAPGRLIRAAAGSGPREPVQPASRSEVAERDRARWALARIRVSWYGCTISPLLRRLRRAEAPTSATINVHNAVMGCSSFLNHRYQGLVSCHPPVWLPSVVISPRERWTSRALSPVPASTLYCTEVDPARPTSEIPCAAARRMVLPSTCGIAQVDTRRGAVDGVPGDRRAPDPVHQRDAVPIRIGDVVAGDRDLPGRADDHDAPAATAHPVVLHAHVEPAGDRDAVVPVVARRAVGDRAVLVTGVPDADGLSDSVRPEMLKPLPALCRGGALADGDVGRGAFERESVAGDALGHGLGDDPVAHVPVQHQPRDEAVLDGRASDLDVA